ncbi:glycosyltransferase family 4 protein [Ghiorsea bivora]|uniref:glycosyltransferase family 4 protein n=1 Tax=Ghiorsea bivora TaxID=1485545 RepID=UPI0005716A3A|nr:glycosyltransferase family 4 protein [Ghiorsea bivora]
MKILELCLSPNKGGLELYFADVCNALMPHMQVLSVIAPNSKLKPLIHCDTIELVKKVHYFPCLAAKKLASIIDMNGIDIIHLHWNKDLTLAVLAKLFSKRKPKLVITRHMKFPAMKDGVLHRFLYQHIDHIMAITQTMALDLKRFIPDDVRPEISVNYLGIDSVSPFSDEEVSQIRALYDAENKNFLIALVGRIDADKGHDLLLEALGIAKTKGLPFKVLVVGHPMQESYLQGLKERVKTQGLQDEMLFLGFVDEPRCLMQACDVLVLATIEETFGLVLIEAMSVGTPVIGSNRGGVPEIIEDKQTGLLFESCDSQSLFEALETLYLNPEQAKTYADKAFIKVQEKFAVQAHIETLVNRLKEVVNG